MDRFVIGVVHRVGFDRLPKWGQADLIGYYQGKLDMYHRHNLTLPH
jgi:hypothetical protein